MKYIGLLSDTHAYLDEKIFHHFELCDEIWHAGDIGSELICDKLIAFKPFKAVHGNIDDIAIRSRFPKDHFFDCEGIKVYLTHIGGRPGKYPLTVRKKLNDHKPGLFVCGHSHILRVISDKSFKNMLYINPGAAGNHGFHLMKTILRFKIDAGKIMDLQVIELGQRSTSTFIA